MSSRIIPDRAVLLVEPMADSTVEETLKTLIIVDGENILMVRVVDSTCVAGPPYGVANLVYRKNVTTSPQLSLFE